MDDTTRSLLGLWTATDDAVGHVGDAGSTAWARPVPGAGADLFDLAVHLAGVHYAGPERLCEAVAAAHASATSRLTAHTPGERELAARCLDMAVHAHDVTATLGEPLDLDAYAPAAMAGCRFVADVAPRLLVAALGARDATVRLVVRAPSGGGAGIDRTIAVAGGHRAEAAMAADDVVEIDPAALLLLVAGRCDPASLAADGSASWSGPVADAFVGAARLA